jgi:Zn finger protein HypA/HybF involved in hydrogenase expression
MRAAGDDATRLPKDAAALRALLLQAWRERDGVVAERDRAARERDDALAQNERLLALLAKLRRMQFGRKSERLSEEQLRFAFEEIAATLAAKEAEAEKNSPQRRAKGTEERRKARGKLPAHLPRVEVVIEPAESACPCCRGTMVVIGADISDRLDVIPAQY